MKRLRQRLNRHRGYRLEDDAQANEESRTTTPQSKPAEVAKPNEETSQPPIASGSQTIEVHPPGSRSNEMNSLTSASPSSSPSTTSIFDANRGGSRPAHPRPSVPSTEDFHFTIDGHDGVMNFNEMMEVLNSDIRRVRDTIITERGSVTRYEPLDTSKNQIRLLDLKPAPWNQMFEVRLRTVSLDDAPSYQALSYTWGVNMATAAMIVDEMSHLIITQNLEDALRHIRSETEWKALWIDAVCIDQSNEVEKADQVRKMLDIYRLAARVLIWLGPRAENSDLALDLIERMPSVDFQSLRQSPASGNNSEWSALRAFYRRPWWSRVWVVQESAIAKDSPIVGCGQRWLSWDIHERAYKLVVDQLAFPHFRLPRHIIHTNVAKIFAIRRRIERTGTDLYIGTILEDVKFFEATNPRDKVFAIYGLIEERFKRYITVDYTKSVRDIFVSMAEFMVTLEPHWILSHTASNSHELPSWVSDWSSSEIKMRFWRPHVYSAGGPKLHPPIFSNPSGQVWLHGAILTTILARAETPCWTISKSFDDLWTAINDYEQFLQTAMNRYPDLEPLQVQAAFRNDAFSRTICADYDPSKAKKDWTQAPTGAAPSERASAEFYDLLQVIQGRVNVPTGYRSDLASEERRKQYVHRLIHAASATLADNTLFVTSWGLIGVASEKLQVDDRVAIIFGVEMPVILRPIDLQQGAYRLIGPAYVHLIMDGLALEFEAIEQAKNAQEGNRPYICLL